MTVSPKKTSSADVADLLCGCVGLTQGAALDRLSAAPGRSFESFLEDTGAGRVCTACMLDLEYFFVEAPRPDRARVADAGTAGRERPSLKQRLYTLIDRLPPQIAYNRSNWMPLLVGPGIEQYLWMANRPMLFDERGEEQDYRVACTVRDAAGKVRHRARFDLPVGGQLRVKLSDHLPANDDLTIGSIQLDRFARRSGVRGTTRPQTEIVTRSAAAALHFQASNRGYDRHFAFFHRPGEDRTFFTLLNCATKPFEVVLRFTDEAGRGLGIERFRLAPHQAQVHEYAPTGDAPPPGTLITTHMHARGLGKIHVVNAAPDLSALSIDHL